MKILYYIIKAVSFILLAPVVLVAIPGAIMHFTAEAIDEYNNK